MPVVCASIPVGVDRLIDTLKHLVALYSVGWWQNAPTEAGAKDPRFAQLSPLIQPLGLDQGDLQALEAFLLALGDGGSPWHRPICPDS